MTEPSRTAAWAVRVEGLAQFSRNLRKLDRDLPKALRLANNEAADLVVGETLPAIPQRTGRARRSVRKASTRTAVRVRAGGARAPYYPWLDFGGRVGKGRSVIRPFDKHGRYLYAGYFRLRGSGEFERVLSEALVGVAEQAGIEVT
jgi:hypothetical protein